MTLVHLLPHQVDLRAGEQQQQLRGGGALLQVEGQAAVEQLLQACWQVLWRLRRHLLNRYLQGFEVQALHLRNRDLREFEVLALQTRNRNRQREQHAKTGKEAADAQVVARVHTCAWRPVDEAQAYCLDRHVHMRQGLRAGY